MADQPVQIRLPEDHPIFSYPKGERAGVLRRWIELGRLLDRSNVQLVGQIRMVIREELNSLGVSLSGGRGGSEKGGGPGRHPADAQDTPLKTALSGFLNLSDRGGL